MWSRQCLPSYIIHFINRPIMGTFVMRMRWCSGGHKGWKINFIVQNGAVAKLINWLTKLVAPAPISALDVKREKKFSASIRRYWVLMLLAGCSWCVLDFRLHVALKWREERFRKCRKKKKVHENLAGRQLTSRQAAGSQPSLVVDVISHHHHLSPITVTSL